MPEQWREDTRRRLYCQATNPVTALSPRYMSVLPLECCTADGIDDDVVVSVARSINRDAQTRYRQVVGVDRYDGDGDASGDGSQMLSILH